MNVIKFYYSSTHHVKVSHILKYKAAETAGNYFEDEIYFIRQIDAI